MQGCSHLDAMAKEGEQQLLVGFAEGGVTALVDQEHSRGQHKGLHRLPIPPDNLLLRWQHRRHIQHNAHLGTVPAQAPHLIPALPWVILLWACNPHRTLLDAPTCSWKVGMGMRQADQMHAHKADRMSGYMCGSWAGKILNTWAPRVAASVGVLISTDLLMPLVTCPVFVRERLGTLMLLQTWGVCATTLPCHSAHAWPADDSISDPGQQFHREVHARSKEFCWDEQKHLVHDVGKIGAGGRRRQVQYAGLQGQMSGPFKLLSQCCLAVPAQVVVLCIWLYPGAHLAHNLHRRQVMWCTWMKEMGS